MLMYWFPFSLEEWKDIYGTTVASRICHSPLVYWVRVRIAMICHLPASHIKGYYTNRNWWFFPPYMPKENRPSLMLFIFPPLTVKWKGRMEWEMEWNVKGVGSLIEQTNSPKINIFMHMLASAFAAIVLYTVQTCLFLVQSRLAVHLKIPY